MNISNQHLSRMELADIPPTEYHERLLCLGMERLLAEWDGAPEEVKQEYQTYKGRLLQPRRRSRMNTDTYYIPVNFTNAGRILGLFEIRNLIGGPSFMPAGAVCVPDISALLPDAEDHRDRLAGGAGPHQQLWADGRQRRQSDAWLKGWWAWHCRRRMMFFRGVVTA